MRAALLALLFACNDGTTDSDTGDSSPPVDVSWESVLTVPVALSGVWGAGPDHAVAVGGNVTDASVYLWDGSTWSEGTAPELPMLVWAQGFAADDIYVVGFRGGFAHWDGQAWTTIPTGVQQDLWGIFGARADDLWIVGGAIDEGDPLILHWDGAQITAETLPPEANSRFAHSLFKVFGVDDRLFAVGQRGLIVEHTADGWVEQSTGAEANEDFVSLWGTSEDNLTAVGGRSTPRVSLYNGTTWDTSQPQGLNGLNAITFWEDDLAIIAGVNGSAARLTPSTGELVPEITLSTTNLHGAWADSDRVWVVGGDFGTYDEGEILARTED